MTECEPLPRGSRHVPRVFAPSESVHGRAMQGDPIKPTLKLPGTNRMKLEYEKLLSSVAFKFNLRRYSTELRKLCNHPVGRCGLALSNPS